MKVTNIISAFAILVATLAFQSCSRDNASSVNANTTDGNWRVSLYYDNSDETYKFTGYTFTFNSNGSITATNGSNSANGTWSQGSSKFNIDFGTTAVFSDLNDDWLIEEITSSSIRLKDDNPARDEKLQFIR